MKLFELDSIPTQYVLSACMSVTVSIHNSPFASRKVPVEMATVNHLCNYLSTGTNVKFAPSTQ